MGTIKFTQFQGMLQIIFIIFMYATFVSVAFVSGCFIFKRNGLEDAERKVISFLLPV